MSVAVVSFAVPAASQVGTAGPANMAPPATAARLGLRAGLPFVAGVALGKQLVIWPVGFGLTRLADRAPWSFETLKRVSAACICWLAWQVANLHPLWTFAGDRMTHALAGIPGEAYLMWTLAVLTVLSVFFVLFTGGTNP